MTSQQLIKTDGQFYQKLQFRIVHCDGSDEEYPENELLTQSPQSKGWQSQRFCEYPIEMVFQFIEPVRIKLIQFLSHQAKIASKIDIYIFLPDKNVVQNNIINDIKFKKLGFLSLDSNERSQFQARELKSVYLDNPCLYLKLVFQKCHINKYNLFNQVGLIALSVFGEPIFRKKDANLQNKGFEQLEYETQFDQITLDRLRILHQAKLKAVEKEDFVEAKRLKDMSDRLKQVGLQLQYLEERKMVAVDKDDFDSAQIIKNEIDKLRNTISPENLLGKYGQQVLDEFQQSGILPFSYENHQQQKQFQKVFPGSSGIEHNMATQQQSIEQPTIFTNQNQMDTKIRQKIIQEQKNLPQIKIQNKFQQQDQPFDLEQNITEEIQQHEKDQDQNEQNIISEEIDNIYIQDNNKPIQKNQKTNKHSEEAIIPALLKKGNNMMTSQENPFGIDEHGQDQKEHQGLLNSIFFILLFKAEKLSKENLQKVSNLISVFGQDLCSKLVSKNWQLREEAVEILNDQVKNQKGQKKAENFLSFLEVINIGLEDKISIIVYIFIQKFFQDQVVQKTLQFLIDTLSIFGKKVDIQNKQDLQTNVENILINLLEKIGDNNSRIQQAACEAFIEMASCPLVTTSLCVQYLAKTQSKGKLASNKHLSSRLTILLNIIKNYQIDNQNVPLQIVLEFANKSLEHSSAEVRQSAIMVAVEAAKFAGEYKIKQYLSNLKPSQLEIFDKELQNAGGISKQQIQKQTISSPTKKNQVQKQTKQQFQKENKAGYDPESLNQDFEAPTGPATQNKQYANNPNQCEFCGKFDKNFSDEGKYDIHMWKDCPMLCTCEKCNQVIEISGYNEHLLTECQQRTQMRKCPRCKEAIKLKDFQDHTQILQCKPFQPLNIANRCPLCHTDIQPRLQGWKKHLLQEGCSNNERSNN